MTTMHALQQPRAQPSSSAAASTSSQEDRQQVREYTFAGSPSRRFQYSSFGIMLDATTITQVGCWSHSVFPSVQLFLYPVSHLAHYTLLSFLPQNLALSRTRLHARREMAPTDPPDPQAQKQAMIDALNQHRINTIGELRRVERIFATLGSPDLTQPMTAACWSIKWHTYSGRG